MIKHPHLCVLLKAAFEFQVKTEDLFEEKIDIASHLVREITLFSDDISERYFSNRRANIE